MTTSFSRRQIACTDAITEPELQRIIDNWITGKNGWKICGAPDWLLRNGGQNLARFSRHSEGKYKPDVVWKQSEYCVIELKRADEYSDFADIALPQVLHYAWHHKDDDGRRPLPVIVMPYSYYMRAALNYLFLHGLDRKSVRYVEATGLAYQGENFLWLYEPFADRLPLETMPTATPIDSAYERTHCFQLDGTATWIGVPTPVCSEPPLTPIQSVFVATIDGEPGRHITCVCDGPDERYFLYEARPRLPEVLN